MKVVLLVFLALVAVAYCATSSKTTYTTRYDHLNIDEILYNNRLLRSYYKCIVGQGPCTAEGAELKRIFPDAIKTKCKKCTPAQKKNARKVIEFIRKYRPEMWEGVLKRYDPKGELTKDILSDPNFLG